LQARNHMHSAFLRFVRSWTGKLLAQLRTAGHSTAALRSKTAVLPILTRQLRDTSRDVETAVSEVCRSFHGMASKAREAVRNASEMLAADDGSGGGISTVIQGCRQTMVTLLDRLERGGALSRGAIEKMELVQTSVGRIARVLEEVEQAALANRIVALNARIEAVHLGEAGKGFEVVAEEISAQAERSTALTCEVRSVLEGLMASAREAVTGLRELAAADRAWIDSSRTEISQSLSALEHATGSLTDSLVSASEQSRHLAGEIDAALLHLQFQDRVNQRIQHVTEALESMHTAISGGETSTADSAARPDQAVSTLAASYTMRCERDVHNGGDEAVPAAGEESDVELF
jgi:methyl-accepting chemotaxis protein